MQIISEAAKVMPAELLAENPDAPWSAIIGIGNILRHDYQRIDDKRIRDIVSVHLPKLHPVIERMIKTLERASYGRKS